MGYKTTAREKMIAAGVPVVPGAHVGSEDELPKLAAELGYPVMLKAAGGGGGKGMRLVEREADLLSGFRTAKSEAASAFGDDLVYMEKAIVEPRHVEIPDPRRHPRQPRAPLRARLLDPAAPPEGRRGDAEPVAGAE